MVLGVVGDPFISWWVVACVFGALWAATVFLLYQLARWPFRRWADAAWLVGAVGVYWLLQFPLAAVWQSLAFLTLVCLNLWLVFRTRRTENPRLIFFDMTLCYLLSISLIGAGPDGVDRLESPAVILNLVILAVLVLGYFVASQPTQRPERSAGLPQALGRSA